MTGSLPRRFATGALAGAVGGLAFTLVSLVLRLVAGVPLVAELLGDRIIPMLHVQTFVRLLGRVGGPLRGKSLSFSLTLVGHVVVGALIGVVFALVFDRRADRGWSRGALVVLLGTSVAAILVGLVLLWPVLDSNYIGLPSPWARIVASIGLALDIGAFAAAFLTARHLLGAGRGQSVPGARGRRVLARTRPTTNGDEGQPRFGRRAVLLGGAGMLAAGASFGLADVLYRRATFGAFGYDGLMVRGPRTEPITPTDDFYVVTKNLIDPRVSSSVWRLRIDGLVADPMEFDLDALRSLPRVTQVQTLECISNGVGAGLMSNAEWVGVSMGTLLAAALPRSGVERVVMRGADGFVHTVSMDRAMDPSTIVAYEMNGGPLPHRHGYPARVLVPGAYGEVSVKWIEGVELSAAPVEGYYERQGWRAYVVQTTSRFDRPAAGQAVSLARTPTVSVGGVAYAGDRGISRVEWSADGGTTWSPAHITYAPSRIAWSLWEAVWSPTSVGDHRLVVRAIDGDGVVQPGKRHGVVPSGAAGWHAVSVSVRP